MPVARLSRVTVRTEPADLGRTVGALLAFGEFHPSARGGLVQEIHLLLLGSRAQRVYGRAGDLLARPELAGTSAGAAPVAEYPAADVARLLDELEENLETLARNLGRISADEDRATAARMLAGIRAAGLEIFHAVDRLFAVPTPPPEIRLEGWVPTRSVPRLRAALGARLGEVVPVRTRGPDDPYVPTLLVNPRAFAVFERITLDRGVPKYNEIDPTPLVALVFPLFFGLMFGDLGHGVVLLALGAYLLVGTRWRSWGELLLVFGVAAAAVGIVRGVAFGVVFPSPFAPWLAGFPALSAGFTLAYIPLLLEASVLVGTFHLASAYALAVVNKVRSDRWSDALVDSLPTLVLYASLVPMGLAVLGTGLHPLEVLTSPAPTPFFRTFLGVSVPVADTARVALPLVLVALGALALGPFADGLRRHRGRRRLRAAVREGAIRSVARPVEFFVNTLSYIRLAALLITNTLLGALVAGTLRFGVAGVAVAAFLNVLVMAMEGLIIYLQDMRLHWYEWMSKFYEGTGTPFRPLRPTSAVFRAA